MIECQGSTLDWMVKEGLSWGSEMSSEKEVRAF